jgi:hypothetical protein
MTMNKHSRSNLIPHNPRPAWVALLEIPPNCNVGKFVLAYTLAIVEAILFGPDGANSLNRPLKLPKLRPIILSIKNGTFVEDWVDPILFDYNWKLISGQKRLYAIYYAWHERHSRYRRGIRIRTEYGVPPEYRPLSDGSEERASCDKKHFIDGNKKANALLHQSLIFAVKAHFRIYAHALTPSDLERLLVTNPEGFKWAAKLHATKSLSMAPIRLGLAEGWKINRAKATAFAEELLDNAPSNAPRVLQAGAYRKFINQMGRRRGDQTEPYEKLVCALRSYFEGDDSAKRLRSSSWNEEEKAILGYPAIENVDLKDKADRKSDLIPDYFVIAAAVRLVSRNPVANHEFIDKCIVQNMDRWLCAQKVARRWRKVIGCYSRAAFVAFAYRHQADDGFDALVDNERVKADVVVAAQRIRAEHGSFNSRAARDACMAELYHVTNLQPPNADERALQINRSIPV